MMPLDLQPQAHSGLVFLLALVSNWIHLICRLSLQTCGRRLSLPFLQAAFPEALRLLSYRSLPHPTLKLPKSHLNSSPSNHNLPVLLLPRSLPILKPLKVGNVCLVPYGPSPELGHRKHFLNE